MVVDLGKTEQKLETSRRERADIVKTVISGGRQEHTVHNFLLEYQAVLNATVDDPTCMQRGQAAIGGIGAYI